MELYPLHAPGKAVDVDGAIEKLFAFHHTHHYYAHGIGPDTAHLPPVWRDRLIRHSSANTNGAVGWCLEAHDLAFSKPTAGRSKDLEYVAQLLGHRMVARDTLLCPD